MDVFILLIYSPQPPVLVLVGEEAVVAEAERRKRGLARWDLAIA